MGRKSPAAISAPGGERGASGTIIDITCHVNIGYRHRPLYLPAEKRAAGKKITGQPLAR